MNTLQVGFSRVNVTPMMGITLRGYFETRYADGVLDELEINALALACGETKALIMTLDIGGMATYDYNVILQSISEATGLPVEAILIHITHTHTAGHVGFKSSNPLVVEYSEFVKKRFVDAATFALADLKPAKMGWAVGRTPDIAFIRRYRMKDGSVRTNPGVGNPDILHPIGSVDDRLNVLRFDREGAETIVLANVGNHPDCIGGCKISADWPAMFRRKTEKALDNVKAIFINGAEGDVNHVNVNAKDGERNHLDYSFGDGPRGYGYAGHIANVVMGGMLQVYETVNYVDVDSLRYTKKIAQVPSNMPKPEEMPLAHKYNDLYNAGKTEEIPFKDMELTTVVADARRKVMLEHGPEFFNLPLSALAVGNVAFFGIPGEPFNDIGVGVKTAEGWDMVLPSCLTNGGEGYFPMQDSYDEGGYEAKTSRYKAGTAELIIEEAKAILATLR